MEEYINKQPEAVRAILQKVRHTIKKAVPKSAESFSYGVPAFKLNGKNLVLFAGFKKHLGIYPGPEAIEAFQKELSDYKTAKGTIQFPFDKPIPYSLIAKIVKHQSRESIYLTR